MEATYSPDDNKLRLYAGAKLPPDVYARVKGAGFIWAPRQGLFVAPAWTPDREDLLLELCGAIGDDDTSLVERQEERADRFEGYSDRRDADAAAARKVSDELARQSDGQPILIGHHSERRTRRHYERIADKMNESIALWRTAQYWADRAAGAIRHAKYKERPDVRARRIKTLEASRRKHARARDEAEMFLSGWTDPQKELTRERALAIASYSRGGGAVRLPDGSECWSAWSAIEDNKLDPTAVRDQLVPRYRATIAWHDRWIEHYDHRLGYERAMQAEGPGIPADRVAPEVGGGCQCWASPIKGWSYIRRVNKVSVTVEDNFGNGGRNFTRTIPFDKLEALLGRAEVEAARAAGRLAESHDGIGFFLA